MIDFAEALRWLRRHWVGLVVTYFVVLVGTYATIWFFIEPMGIPDSINDLNSLPNLMRLRVFYHASLSFLIGAHITLILDIIFRRDLRHVMLREGIVRNDRAKVALILGAGDTGAKLIEILSDMGIAIEGVYDNKLDAAGIILARKKKIPIFAGDSLQLVAMLKECQEHLEKQYTLFLASEYPRFVELVDAKSRSQRRRSKNFRLLRLGIDFDEDTTPIEYLQLW